MKSGDFSGMNDMFFCLHLTILICAQLTAGSSGIAEAGQP
jgi:hypothetical protein